MDPLFLNSLSLPKVGFAVPAYFLWGVFGFIALLSVIFGSVMSYHYRDFGFEAIKTTFLSLVYTVVCASLLAISASFIFLYLSSL